MKWRRGYQVMKKQTDKEIFLGFMDCITYNFKKRDEVVKNYKKVLQFLLKLHIQEESALKYAEIIFRSAGLLPQPRTTDELNECIVKCLVSSNVEDIVKTNKYIILPLYTYLLKVYIGLTEEGE